MIFNAAGLKLIKEFEGCSLVSYQDQGGVWTIGYGTTKDVKQGMAITAEDAEKMLEAHVSEVCDQVTKALVNQLNANQFSALVCFTYNEGIGHLMQSTLLHCINTYHIDDAANEFLRWDKIGGIEKPGLLRRRQAERALFLTPVL